MEHYNLDRGLAAMANARAALEAAAEFLDSAIQESNTAIDMARLFVFLKEGREAYDAESKRIGKLMNFVGNSRLPDLMETEDLKLIKFDQLKRRVQVAHRQSCVIISGQRDFAFDWLRDNGHGALITETVNSSTLAAFGKDYVDEHAEDLPVDIFKTTVQPYISVVKI